MADETLRLTVDLVDNATPQLARIRGQMQNLGSSETSNALRTSATRLKELREHFKPLGEGIDKVTEEILPPFISGLLRVSAGAIGVGVAVGGTIEKIKDFTNKMIEFNRLSRETGTSGAQIESFVETAERAGIAADTMKDGIRKFSDNMADLSRANSKFRQEMIQSTVGPSRDLMGQWLNSLVGKDKSEQLNEVKKKGQEVFDNAAKALREQWGKSISEEEVQTGAAGVRKSFFAQMGLPDIGMVKEAFKTVSEEEKKVQQAREQAALKFNSILETTKQHAEHISDALAFKGMAAAIPIMEKIDKFFEKWDQFFKAWQEHGILPALMPGSKLKDPEEQHEPETEEYRKHLEEIERRRRERREQHEREPSIFPQIPNWLIPKLDPNPNVIPKIGPRRGRDLGAELGIGDIPQHQEGGFIPRDQFAMLHAGEMVQPAEGVNLMKRQVQETEKLVEQMTKLNEFLMRGVGGGSVIASMGGLAPGLGVGPASVGGGGGGVLGALLGGGGGGLGGGLGGLLGGGDGLGGLLGGGGGGGGGGFGGILWGLLGGGGGGLGGLLGGGGGGVGLGGGLGGLLGGGGGGGGGLGGILGALLGGGHGGLGGFGGLLGGLLGGGHGGLGGLLGGGGRGGLGGLGHGGRGGRGGLGGLLGGLFGGGRGRGAIGGMGHLFGGGGGGRSLGGGSGGGADIGTTNQTGMLPWPGEGGGGAGGATADQANRPAYMHGLASIEGTPGQFHWGSGGAPGSRGSIPYGDYPIAKGAFGPIIQRLGGLGLNKNEIFDPKLKSMRGGIAIHPGSGADLDRLYTLGCFAIAPSEWPRAKAAILAQSAKGQMYLHVGPGGQASMTHDPGGKAPVAVEGVPQGVRPGGASASDAPIGGGKYPTEAELSDKSRPAGERFNNPFNMWFDKYAKEQGGLPGRQITQFDTPSIFPSKSAGAAATIRKMSESKLYSGKTMQDLIGTWVGHGESYAPIISKMTGIPANTRITPEFLKSEQGLAFLKAMARYETKVSEPYPLTDEQWRAARANAMHLGKSEEAAAVRGPGDQGAHPYADMGPLGRAGIDTAATGDAKAEGIDRGAMDRSMQHTVTGTGKISVDVNAPKGTMVRGHASGLFKKVEVNRQTQMDRAPKQGEPATMGADQ